MSRYWYLLVRKYRFHRQHFVIRGCTGICLPVHGCQQQHTRWSSTAWSQGCYSRNTVTGRRREDTESVRRLNEAFEKTFWWNETHILDGFSRKRPWIWNSTSNRSRVTWILRTPEASEWKDKQKFCPRLQIGRSQVSSTQWLRWVFARRTSRIQKIVQRIVKTSVLQNKGWRYWIIWGR